MMNINEMVSNVSKKFERKDGITFKTGKKITMKIDMHNLSKQLSKSGIDIPKKVKITF